MSSLARGLPVKRPFTKQYSMGILEERLDTGASIVSNVPPLNPRSKNRNHVRVVVYCTQCILRAPQIAGPHLILVASSGAHFFLFSPYEIWDVGLRASYLQSPFHPPLQAVGGLPSNHANTVNASSLPRRRGSASRSALLCAANYSLESRALVYCLQVGRYHGFSYPIYHINKYKYIYIYIYLFIFFLENHWRQR